MADPRRLTQPIKLREGEGAMKKEGAASQSAGLEEAVAEARAAGGYAGSVLRSDLLSVGVYVLPAGGAYGLQPKRKSRWASRAPAGAGLRLVLANARAGRAAFSSSPLL